MEKKLLVKLEISIGAIIILLILSFVLAFFTQNSVDKKASEQIQLALNNYTPDTYIVKEKIFVDDQISTIGKFYLIENEKTKEFGCGVVVRIMGISGPITGIFLHENNFTTFINFTGFENIRTYNNHAINLSQLAYWEHRITSVVLNLTQIEGEVNDK